MKILIIDDLHDTAQMMGEMLRTSGYDVLIEYGSVMGLHQIIIESPDVVVCDVELPRFTGDMVLQEIRLNPSVYGTPKVIMITANTIKHSKKSLLKLGADDVLYKPFTMQELINTIERVIRDSKTDDK